MFDPLDTMTWTDENIAAIGASWKLVDEFTGEFQLFGKDGFNYSDAYWNHISGQ